MNKEMFSGKWNEVKGMLKQKWGKLTDDDLLEIEGDNQMIYGKLKQRYGMTKEDIERQLKHMSKH